MRGVWFFLLFVLALAGWGMYFYSSSKALDVVSYDVYDQEKDAMLNAVVEDAKAKEHLLSNKEKVLKAKEQRLAMLEQEKQKLEDEYKTLLERVNVLQTEYNELKKKSESSFSEMRQKDEMITEYKKETARLKKANEKLQVQIAALKGQRDALKAQNTRLKAKQEQIENNLQDIGFLKRALKRAKRLFIEHKRQKQREKDLQLLKKGNRGFLIFQGKNTLRKDVEILVIPADG